MISFVLELDTLADEDDADLDDILTEVEVTPSFTRELKDTFDDLDAESEQNLDLRLSEVCKFVWEEDEESDRVQEYVRSLAEDLYTIQQAEKGLLFHGSDSEILVAHYHQNAGWVHESNELISGDRIDKDSVISMFSLEPSDEGSRESIVDLEYYTDSTRFLEIFGVLSDDELQVIPEQEAYLNGDPKYEDRYSVTYSFGREHCLEMLSDNMLSLDSANDEFTITKELEDGVSSLEYEFDGGRFGLSRVDTLAGFERDYIQYKHGWLTSNRVYRHLVRGEDAYVESRAKVELSDAEIRKSEEQSDNGDVIFSRFDDDGTLSQMFADKILNSIVGNDQYRIYIASHQNVPEHEVIKFESNDHSLSLPNIRKESIEEGKTELQTMYNHASDDGLEETRRRATAAGLLIGVSEKSTTSAAESIREIVLSSSYGQIAGFVKEKLESASSSLEFETSLNAYFDTIGTETRRIPLLEDGFSRESYNRLVDMIDEAGQALELSAGDFVELGEEGYRSVVSGSVDPRIDGNITREAETTSGPTDMRIRNSEGDVVYIGECKYWRQGKAAEYSVKKALDQLHSYDQGQQFNSVIVFFASDEYQRMTREDTWEKAEKKLENYDPDYQSVEERDDSPRSRLYKLRLNDEGAERFVSLHVFDVGAERHHDTDASEESTSAS
jgi:hypothetical protein